MCPSPPEGGRTAYDSFLLVKMALTWSMIGQNGLTVDSDWSKTVNIATHVQLRN